VGEARRGRLEGDEVRGQTRGGARRRCGAAVRAGGAGEPGGEEQQGGKAAHRRGRLARRRGCVTPRRLGGSRASTTRWCGLLSVLHNPSTLWRRPPRTPDRSSQVMPFHRLL